MNDRIYCDDCGWTGLRREAVSDGWLYLFCPKCERATLLAGAPRHAKRWEREKAAEQGA